MGPENLLKINQEATPNRAELKPVLNLAEKMEKYSNKNLVISEATTNLWDNSERNQVTTEMAAETEKIMEAKKIIEKEAPLAKEERNRREAMFFLAAKIDESMERLENSEKIANIKKEFSSEAKTEEGLKKGQEIKEEDDAFSVLYLGVENILKKINLQGRTDKTPSGVVSEYDEVGGVKKVSQIFRLPYSDINNQLNISIEKRFDKDRKERGIKFIDERGNPLSSKTALLEKMGSEKPDVILAFLGEKGITLRLLPESKSVEIRRNGKEIIIGADAPPKDHIGVLKEFINQLNSLGGDSDMGPHTAELQKNQKIAEDAIALIEGTIAKSRESLSVGETADFIQKKKQAA
jgi:hypothetical protein